MLQQKNLNCATGEFRVGSVELEGLKCKLNYKYQRFAQSKRNVLQYSQVQLYTHVMEWYTNFGIGKCKAARFTKIPA